VAFVLKDRVRETSTTTGTGALTLAGAFSNERAFSSVCSVGDTFWYTIIHAGTSWETGIGTYSGTNTLTRTTVLESSNANAAVSFAAGTKDVFIGLPAQKLRASGVVKLVYESGTWNAYGPGGEPISTISSTTSGLQEAINYAQTNGYNLDVQGTSQISIGTAPASCGREAGRVIVPLR
jgi:hypothetical protein